MIVMDEAIKFTSHSVKSHGFLCEKNPHSLVMCGVFYISFFGVPNFEGVPVASSSTILSPAIF
jgi:hypothetical protein